MILILRGSLWNFSANLALCAPRGWCGLAWQKLAKYQNRHNSYTFWAMPILIFSPVQIIMRHPIDNDFDRNSTCSINYNVYNRYHHIHSGCIGEAHRQNTWKIEGIRDSGMTNWTTKYIVDIWCRMFELKCYQMRYQN